MFAARHRLEAWTLKWKPIISAKHEVIGFEIATTSLTTTGATWGEGGVGAPHAMGRLNFACPPHPEIPSAATATACRVKVYLLS